MLIKDLLDKKNKINKILKENNNDFDLMNILRQECERIDTTKKDLILNFEKATFSIDKKKKKVKKVVMYDDNLRKFQEISF